MKRAIKTHIVDFIAILGLLVIATGVSMYILDHQRMRFPLIEDEPFILKFEFSTGQAVTPGQGQTVRISGVRIGDIAKVELNEGRAIITTEIDKKWADRKLIHSDASALLRPKTGLKDMFIELMPGSKDAPLVKESDVIPLASTLPDVNPDEFLSSLDADTRDYLKLLLSGARGGLTGRADDLRAVLKRFEPTQRDINLVSGEVAKRRGELRRLVHSLNRLNAELGRKDDDLAELVATSATVFETLASERENLAATIRELPSALTQVTDTMRRVERFAAVVPSATTRLRPAIRALRRANKATLPFAREAAPLLRDDIRPFVRELRPLMRDLKPAVHDLVVADPTLKRTVVGLNKLFNLLGYNEGGRQAPGAAGRDEGYLFYLAWLAHQSTTLFASQDANGVYRPFILGGTCQTIRSTASTVPQAEALLGLTGVLSDPNICGTEGGPPPKRKRSSSREVSRPAAPQATATPAADAAPAATATVAPAGTPSLTDTLKGLTDDVGEITGGLLEDAGGVLE